MGDRVLIEHIKLIMEFLLKGTGPAPKDDGMRFFPFEEDSSHHINKSLLLFHQA